MHKMGIFISFYDAKCERRLNKLSPHNNPDRNIHKQVLS